ncbi:hypothetical protein GSI_05239 [Ganoderma sinense ZZ0214-1]|uniref:Uncharacterized protein n=1 Tax=Ganoderma sinense ZZ0214-1 TaxID=1077348 RepID=A0A2G8SFJ6_9APHY|nr:hypothetical protein GSI_05239 [Ganoderma sinense ZZ0214-1]
MLRNRPIVLENFNTILRFHDFIFSDAAARPRHIVVLRVNAIHREINPDPVRRERVVAALLAILQRAPSLVSLELSSSANGRPLGYLDDTRLVAAVGKLATLRELTIGGRTQSADFIGAVRAPLTKFTLRFMKPAGGLNEWSPTSLIGAISHFAPSLESLSIWNTRVRLEDDDPSSPLSIARAVTGGIQFHALRSLTIAYLVTVPRLPLLFELFPNLDDTLHLAAFLYDYPDDVELDERYNTFFRAAREENDAAQRQLQQGGRRGWQRLKRLVCDVETLFVLNLGCPIGLTIVESCEPDPDSEMGGRVVRVGGALARRDDPPEAAATLTHLTLCVKYEYQVDSTPEAGSEEAPTPSYPGSWDDVWRDTLLPALEPLHALTHFRLVFHCEVWWKSHNASPSQPPARTISNDPFLASLRPTSSQFDFAAVGSAIAHAVPSLQYCFLTSSAWVAETKVVGTFSIPDRWRESRAWRVARCAPNISPRVDKAELHEVTKSDSIDAGGKRREPELVSLHDDVAETIIEREDLVLSFDEVTTMRWKNI